MARGKAKSDGEVKMIDALVIEQDRVRFCVLGSSPLLLNRMSEKAKRQLLYPSGRKNAAERATTFKHIPYDEFQAAPYRITTSSAPTLLGVPSAAFKRAIASAALDMPGSSKAQIGRLTWVPGDLVSIYGIPKLHMAIVRQAGMDKTPDVRTRAIVSEWAAVLEVVYNKPLVTEVVVSRLLAAAGFIIGVGDGRQEKGALSHGLFELVAPSDARFKAIVKNGGRAAQIRAMEKAEPYDAETEELLTWFEQERVHRRGRASNEQTSSEAAPEDNA